jgi:hypothetical protein
MLTLIKLLEKTIFALKKENNQPLQYQINFLDTLFNIFVLYPYIITTIDIFF